MYTKRRGYHSRFECILRYNEPQGNKMKKEERRREDEGQGKQENGLMFALAGSYGNPLTRTYKI